MSEISDFAQDITDTADRFLREQWPLETLRDGRPLSEQDIRAIWTKASMLGWQWIAAADQPRATLRSASTVAALMNVIGSHPAPIPVIELAVVLPVVASSSPGSSIDSLTTHNL